MVQIIDFTVELKNLSFTLRLSRYFLIRCGINSLRHIASLSDGFRLSSGLSRRALNRAVNF